MSADIVTRHIPLTLMLQYKQSYVKNMLENVNLRPMFTCIAYSTV